jgi:hypothetical protein
MAQLEAILVRNWAVGYVHSAPIPNGTVLQLQFTDRAPINLAFPQEGALAMAKAILDQYSNPPPTPNRRM